MDFLFNICENFPTLIVLLPALNVILWSILGGMFGSYIHNQYLQFCDNCELDEMLSRSAKIKFKPKSQRD